MISMSWRRDQVWPFFSTVTLGGRWRRPSTGTAGRLAGWPAGWLAEWTGRWKGLIFMSGSYVFPCSCQEDGQNRVKRKISSWQLDGVKARSRWNVHGTIRPLEVGGLGGWAFSYSIFWENKRLINPLLQLAQIHRYLCNSCPSKS